MFSKLFKLAKALKQNGNLTAANAVHDLISNAGSPYDSPEIWEIGKGLDEAGEFTFPDQILPSEKEKKPSLEVKDAAKRYVLSHGFKLQSMDWKSSKELEELGFFGGGDQGAWYGKSTPMDPTNLNVEWVLWEVNPGDYGFESAAEIEGSESRLFGES